MNIAKTLIVSGILLVGQAHATEPAPCKKESSTVDTSNATQENQTKPQEKKLPQGTIATLRYMWEHNQYVIPWLSSLYHSSRGCDECEPAKKGFVYYKTTMDGMVEKFAKNSKLSEQEQTALLTKILAENRYALHADGPPQDPFTKRKN